MLRHIVTWSFKDGLTAEENQANALKVKQELESLKGKIDGVIELKVYIDLLSSSNRDVVLDSLFESEAALKAYQIHPEHQRVGGFVGSVLQDRVCVDYYE